MKTYKTFLPLFPGFYNTIFEPCTEYDEIEEINRIRLEKKLPEISYDDCIFNYKEYEENISEDVCYKVAQYLEEIIGSNVDIKKESLISPKFYNFSNDSINIEIDIELNQVIKYIEKNQDEFKDYIKNKYSSCSGFISSYSNDFKDWLNDIKNKDFDSSHKLGSILDFILTNEEKTVLDLFEDCSDNAYIYVENYDELTTS